MSRFSKESLETLRQRIDLVDVLSSHLDLKRTGAAYKTLCPFHDEKSPSFTIQKGDTHYHCFGCGAHGDAIQFLMQHVKLNFFEAVENLARHFHVPLEIIENEGEAKGPDKNLLKKALETACQLYHFLLLHTAEGHAALNYLYGRGMELSFILNFQLGWASKSSALFRPYMHAQGFSDQTLIEAGLLHESTKRDFFNERITIPIRNGPGNVIGFSARKIKEETFGGKYINTPETALFKKSKVLFGLNFCRRRIAKERKAIVVEGQIDALSLIQAGFNLTVAGQGTAFGEGHEKDLATLGINHVFLALDADKAGQEACGKIGNLFQKEGIEVSVVPLPAGSDPDSVLKEKGPEGFNDLMSKSIDYITFLVSHHAKQLSLSSPAGKNELVQNISKQIRQWDNELMVHESLRKLAEVAQVPESMLGVGQTQITSIYVKQSDFAGNEGIDPNRILESDLLRWLVVMTEEQPAIMRLTLLNIVGEDFRDPLCRHFYTQFCEAFSQNRPLDLLSLASYMDTKEAQELLGELLKKKIKKERALENIEETIQKMLVRNWMEKREAVRAQLSSGQRSDDEAMEFAKQFVQLNRTPPIVKKET